MANYSNTQILTAVVAHWAKPLADQVLVSCLGNMQPVVAASEWVRKYFPVPADYSIIRDIAFLAVPATEAVIEPLIGNALSRLNIGDAMIPGYARSIVDACIEEAEKKGKVTIFNSVELEKEDFARLKSLLDKNLPAAQDKSETYKVIE